MNSIYNLAAGIERGPDQRWNPHDGRIFTQSL